MEITDVRIRLVEGSTDRLKAFCTITFDDDFVVRDVKIVEGTSGLFAAMPSRKATGPCPNCRHRNQLRARFCEDCGGGLTPSDPGSDANGRSKMHRDIAHPITQTFREKLQTRIIQAFEEEFGDLSQSQSVEEPAESAEPSVEPSDTRREETPPAEPERREDPPVETVESVEPDEYGSLIAGLKSGSGGRDGNRRDVRRPAQRSAEKREGSPDRQRSTRQREEKVATTKAVPASPDAVATKETSTEAVADHVDLKKQAEVPTQSPDINEDSTPFGAGIH